ncbi:MAG TPA: hypothetical protein VEN99_06235, partial [Acidimicrobiia bacterium]|nr:hypothetical protein [Acidimicrobiia bacterium]
GRVGRMGRCGTVDPVPGGCMELFDILVLVIVVAGGVAGYGAWRRQVLVRQLRADSPPGALVRPDDPLEVVQAKNRTWAMLEEAVRIFHQLMAQDEFMANLQPDTRASIERFLAAYYRRNEGIQP